MSELRIFLDNLWLWKCDLDEKTFKVKKLDSFEELSLSEWDSDFEKKMRARLVMGSIRYGKMGHGCIPKGKIKRDRCASIRKRIDIFESTGNAEYLVDVANEALLIFTEKDHIDFHFESKDDGYHTPEKK